MAATSEELDRVDRKILKLLQERGRMSNVELSRQVNLSPAPCLARVKRLERRGFIRGYHADLDPKKLGLNLLAYVEVTLSSSTPKTLDAFGRAIRAIPEIEECHMVAGRCDYLIKLRCADMEAYRRLLIDTISTNSLVAQTNTHMVIQEVKSTNELAIESATGGKPIRLQHKRSPATT
jgi:Lrp/AsnC family leucine-responsive transcriptional regulator